MEQLEVVRKERRAAGEARLAAERAFAELKRESEKNAALREKLRRERDTARTERDTAQRERDAAVLERDALDVHVRALETRSSRARSIHR
jgi:hypothetical protein